MSNADRLIPSLNPMTFLSTRALATFIAHGENHRHLSWGKLCNTLVSKLRTTGTEESCSSKVTASFYFFGMALGISLLV